MLFYAYNMKIIDKTAIHIFGKTLDENKETQKKTVVVKNIITPILFVCKSDDSNSIEQAKKGILEVFRKKSVNVKLEHKKMKNIFYKKYEEEVDVIRCVPEKKVADIDYDSKFISEQLLEFSTCLENFILSKRVKGPCMLNIKKFEVKGGYTIVNSMEDLEIVRNVEEPTLKNASISLSINGNSIIRFVLNISNKKICAASVIPESKSETSSLQTLGFTLFDDSKSLVDHLKTLIKAEEIDCLIFHNLLKELGEIINLDSIIPCDTYIYAFNNLKCRNYGLEELSRIFEANYIPFNEDDDVGNVCKCLISETRTLHEVFKASNMFLLAKEVAEITGYLVAKILTNHRIETVEYALLHELNERNYLFPPSQKNEDAKYTGGLVLNPEVGLFNRLIILLDFNSLYPSIIQEFNVCFSTVGKTETSKIDSCDFRKSEPGFLPKILKNLVSRRAHVKKLLMSVKDAKEANVFDIRQKALKLIANSIYGCLGSPYTRFCNFNMASYITKKGRELLSEAKTISEGLGLSVIYGDTDSIMINTHLPYNSENITKAYEIGLLLRDKMNALYNSIELEIEKIFKNILIQSKKKYVAVYLDKNNNPVIEYKGIEVVRRDFCKAATEIITSILEAIMLHECGGKEDICEEHIRSRITEIIIEEKEKLSKRPKSDFLINLVLNKPLEKYSPTLPQPHINLAYRMRDKNVIYNQGDVISFVIGNPLKDVPFYKRSFCANEDCKIDYSYYLETQIISPLNRLLSVTKLIGSNKISHLFGFEGTKSDNTYGQITFITECCESVQEVSFECKKCKSHLNESFYLRKTKAMIDEMVSKLYSTPSTCSECQVTCHDFLLVCHICGTKLSFLPRNNEFDMFLNRMQANLASLGYSSVDKLIGLHVDHSKYKEFDLDVYFGDEINAFAKNNISKDK